MASAPNYKMVSAAKMEKMKGLLKWARTQPHPFSACKTAVMKDGKSEEQANKICGVFKDMAEQTTKWRGKK